MRPFLFLFLSIIGLAAFAQDVITHKVEPKGVYKEINLSKDIRVMKLLLDKNLNHSRIALIDSVERNANKYTPPVLYALSNILFAQKKYNDACFWFYLAQLRARYDVNRCADKTANASEYNMNFGPPVNEFAFKHLDSLKIIMPKVVEFMRTNEEQYDQRWINLTGMGAMTASLGDKPANEALSIEKSQWPAIKKKTIDDYYSDFKDAVGLENESTAVDRSNMLGYDYSLFKGTPAWNLAKAVETEDTVKILNIITKDKALLDAEEPKYGQTLLQMAVKTLKFESVKTLVTLGADPNSQDTYDGSSPVMEAAGIHFLGHGTYGSDSRYLQLLLKHGGDPNAEQKGARRKGNNTRYTPLLRACGIGNLECVKMLVSAGANVNYNNEYEMNPLGSAVMFGKNPDVVIYLIAQGADFRRPIYKTINGKNLYVVDQLREWTFDLNSEDYKKKMQIVEFLKKNGMDYSKTKIPEGVENNYPKEYLDKY